MPSRTSLIPGTRIADRFVIDHVETEGGMSIIYRASDALTGQPVAIKLLSVQTIERRTRALREVEILSTLNCRSVVRYVAHETLPSGSLLIAATEWLEGEDLARPYSAKHLSLSRYAALGGPRLPTRWMWCTPLAGCMATSSLGISFSTPGSRDGRADRFRYRPTRRQRDCGNQPDHRRTAHWAPSAILPRDRRGESSDGPAVDLFALGCVFYECLTGTPV